MVGGYVAGVWSGGTHGWSVGFETMGTSAEMVTRVCEEAPLRVIAEALTELGAEVPQGPEPMAERVADALLRAAEAAT